MDRAETVHHGSLAFSQPLNWLYVVYNASPFFAVYLRCCSMHCYFMLPTVANNLMLRVLKLDLITHRYVLYALVCFARIACARSSSFTAFPIRFIWCKRVA